MVFIAACMGMLSFGIVVITIGSLLPGILQEFNIGEAEAGGLTSVLPLGIVLGSLVFGPLADRFGYKMQFIICSLMVMAGLEGIAYTGSLFLLNVSAFLIGLGGGVLNGATNAVVADISEKDKGSSLSLLGVFYGIGALGMPALIGVLSNIFSVEQIITVVGGFICIMSIFFMTIPFPEPKQKQGFPLKEGGKLLKQPIILLAGMLLFFASATEGLFNNWTTLFLTENGSASGNRALYVLSTMMLAMTVMRLFLGGILKRFTPYRVLYLLLLVVLTGCVLLFYSQTFIAALVAAIFIGAGLASTFPVVLGYVAENFPKLSGTAFSIVLVMALTGNMVSNYSLGQAADRWGMSWFPMIGFALTVALMGVLGVLVKNIKKKTNSTL